MRYINHLSRILASCLLVLLPHSGNGNTRDGDGRMLHVPATARGFVGGEAHTTYRLRVRKGEHLTVRLAWRREDANTAEFTISDGATFESAAPLAYGEWTQDRRQWAGTMQSKGTVFIYVVAHPSAHFTLTVRR